MSEDSGTKLVCGAYRVTDTLRSDAALRVLRAEDEHGQAFIVYAIDMGTVRVESLRSRMVYDTERLKSVDIPGIVGPVATDLAGAQSYVVCPWIDGESLASRLSREQLSVETALLIAERILRIVDDLHATGHAHLAIRPRDIFLQGDPDDPSVVLAGLGPLLTLQGVQSEDAAVQIAAHAAPESLGAIEDEIRYTADLYSVGTVLFQCLTGRVPFEGATTGELLFQHMTCPPADVTTLRPSVPTLINDIVQRLLKKDPRDRYQSAGGALHDIRAIRECLARGTGMSTFVPGTHDHRETLTSAAFVGRANELSLLHSELELARTGADRTVLLTAASGIGKSRLQSELLDTAQRKGFRVFRGRGCDEPGMNPIASLQELLRDVAGLIQSDASIRERAKQNVRLLQAELLSASPELAELLDCEAAPEAKTDLTDRRVAFAIAQVLSSCGSEADPLLILMDDAQWLDDLSLAVLRALQDIESPWTLLVIAARPPESAASNPLSELSPHLNLTLEPLDRDGVRTLLESMAGTLPDLVVDTVWEISEGSPFAAEGVLRGLVESGTLRPEQSTWHFDRGELSQLQLNGEAAEVLKLRLNRLPDSVRDALKVGAVLGREFALDAAASILQVTEADLLERLEEPRHLHLVWLPAAARSCAFMHDQIRSFFLQELPEAEERQIHLRAADFLVENYRHRVFEISSHYAGGGRPDLAQPFALKAARLARTRHSLEVAEEQYRIVLSSCAQSGAMPETDVLQGIGDVLVLLGRYSEAEEFFEQAAARDSSPEVTAEIALKLGELAFKRDEKDRAVELWEAALRHLGGRVPSVWLMPLFAVREILVQILHTLWPALFVHREQKQPELKDRLTWRLHSKLAYAYWYLRGKAALLWVHLRGLNLAERYPPTPELAQAWSEHGPAMTLVSLNRRGIHYARKSLRVREQLNDLWGQGQSLHFLSIVLYSASQFRECIEVGRRSMQILDRAGDYWEKLIAQYQVAASHYRLGEFEEAVREAQQAYQSGLAVGEEQVCTDIVEVWARAAFGNIPQSVVGRELQRERSDVQGNAHVLLAEAVRLAEEQEFDAAIAHLSRGIRSALSAGVINTYTSPLFAWRASLVRLQRQHSPPATARRAGMLRRRHWWYSIQALFIGFWFRNELPHALREYGLSLAARGSLFRSRWLLRKSLSVARRQEATWEELQSSHALAQVRAELSYRDRSAMLQVETAKRDAFLNSDRVTSSMPTNLSLADRFDSLLDDGRQIASAVAREDIVTAAVAATRRMLRCDFCQLAELSEVDAMKKTAHELADVASRALRLGCTQVDSVRPGRSDDYRSRLASPVSVRGERVAVLIAASSEVGDLFGQNEIRIANYIATISGAALENADSFSRLQDLNANLERIVELRTAAVEARSEELLRTADDLRRTQGELVKARDAAESANQAKTSFLAHMSHEIRTPIGAVLGFAELLETGDDELAPQQAAHVARILSNGRHLLNLLNDLLDLSRIEAGETSIELLDCRPFPLLHDVLTALQSRALEKGLQLTLKIRDQIPDTITTDPTRLRQILTNLIGNAIKFTEDGGVFVESELDVAQELLTIHVIDSGVGIDAAAQSEIFESFRQADNSVTRRFGGTGLGLAISRRLARALGGDVVVSSEPGAGSTFSVSISTGSLSERKLLTREQASQTQIASSGESPPLQSLRGLRVLVVDDVDENRQFISTVLKRVDADVELACDGQEAIDFVPTCQPDLILMDMQMPHVDGYAATAALREQGCAIPILALTANGMAGDADRCVAAGCTGYVSKPVSINTLLSAIAAQIDVEELARRTGNSTGQVPPANQQPSGTADSGDSGQSSAPPAPHLPDRLRMELPDDAFLAELALSFLQKVAGVLPEMNRWVASRNTERLSWHGHWLKGTGGTVGLPLISTLGAQIDEAAKRGDLATCGDGVSDLSEAVVDMLLRLPEGTIRAPGDHAAELAASLDARSS